jgi:hypothetical protein
MYVRQTVLFLLAILSDSVAFGIRFLSAHIRSFLGRPIPALSP